MAYAFGLGALPDPNSPSYNNYIQYVNTLWGNANFIDNTLVPQARDKMGAWTTQARAAGVAEANIISYLTPFNAWEDAMKNLSSIIIPTEIKRIQQGGALPEPQADTAAITAPYKWTFPPALADIPTLLGKQGGALTGAAQYSAPISPVTAPPANIPTIYNKVQVQTTAAGSVIVPNTTLQDLPVKPIPASLAPGAAGDGTDASALALSGGMKWGWLLLAGAGLYLLKGKRQ